MSEPLLPLLTELDILVRSLDGQILDERAQAQDVTPSGFRLQSRMEIPSGQEVLFIMDLGDGDRVEGMAELLWSEQDEWGWYVAGAKITQMSWRDKRKVRRRAYRPGFDFAGLARKAAIAAYWLVIVAGAREIAFHQPHIRRALTDAAPAVVAALVISLGLTMLTW